MRINKLLSLCIIVCLLVSSLGTLHVAAAAGDLLFDMDLTNFVKGNAGESWGIRNKVTSSNVTIKANDGATEGGVATGEITKQSYINAKGETVSYLNYDQKITTGTYSGPNSCNRIWIEAADWANKKMTVEIWLKAEAPKSTDTYLLRLFGEDDNDRTSLDRSLLLNATTGKNWQYQGTLTSGSNAATSSTNFSDGQWVHVAISKDITSSKTGKGVFYVNGQQISSGTIYAKAMTETAAGLLLGTIATQNVNTAPDNLGIASVKIYDGVLALADVKAHYAAEVNDFSEGASTLEIVSETPAAGSEILTHNVDSFNLKFNSCINEDTLEEGIILRDSNGTEIPAVKTLSDDMMTVAVTPAGYLSEGQYRVCATEELMSLNGINATPGERSYTVKLLNYTPTWTKWTNTDGYVYSDFNTAGGNELLKAHTSNTSAKYTVADNQLSIMPSSSAGAFIILGLDGAVSTGTVIVEFTVSGGSATEYGLNTMPSGESEQRLIRYSPDKLYKWHSSNTQLEFGNNTGNKNENGKFNIRAEFSRDDENDTWSYKIYNNTNDIDKVGPNGTLTSKAALTGFKLGTGKGTSAIVYENISVKHQLEYVGGMSAKMISGGDIVYYIYDVNEVLKDLDDTTMIVIAAYSDEAPHKLLAVNVHEKGDISEGTKLVTGSFTFDESLNSAPVMKLMKIKSWDSVEPSGKAIETVATLYTPGE